MESSGLDLGKWKAITKKYGISFDADTSRSQWPNCLRTTFDSVKNLGMQQWENYTDDISATIAREPWRAQRKQRAISVVMNARECMDARVNERTWRSKIEPIIAGRFSIDVACKECRGRLWRSEQEVVPTYITNDVPAEPNGDLVRRQKHRSACKCPSRYNDTVDDGMSQLFVNCCEEGIVHPDDVRRDINKRETQPDRVFGLRSTKTIDRLLQGEDKRQSNSGKLLRETIRTTPFRPSVGPFLFPFLVLESKSGKGKDAFTDIENQTVFAIREILRLQEDLQVAAEQMAGIRWDAAPLVWFLAHRGENWRLMASYPGQNNRGKTYHVARLWSGNIDTRAGALQFILLLDFICDWARDMYRDMIKTSLRALVVRERTDSTVFSSDVLSLNGPDKIGTWGTLIGEMARREPTPSSYAETDPFRAFDMDTGTVRDIRYIRSRLLGIYVTDQTLDTLLMGTPTDGEADKLVERLLRLLRTSGFVVEKSSLDTLELSWTGKERSGDDEVPSDQRFIVAACIAAYFTSDWEQSREVFFVAVDEPTAQSLCERINMDDARIASLFGKAFVDQNFFRYFFSTFQRHSAVQNMLACFRLSYIHVLPTNSMSGALMAWKLPLAYGPGPGEAPTYNRCAGEFAQTLSESHTVGRIKPSSILFRRSDRLDQVPVVSSSISDESEILDTPLWPIDDTDFQLVHRHDSKVLFAAAPPGHANPPRFCAIVMDPTKRNVREALRMVRRSGPGQYQECDMVGSVHGWISSRNRALKTRETDMKRILNSFATYLQDDPLPADDPSGSSTSEAKGKERAAAGTATVRVPLPPEEVRDVIRGTLDNEMTPAASPSKPSKARDSARVREAVAEVVQNSPTSREFLPLPGEARQVRRSKRLCPRGSNDQNE